VPDSTGMRPALARHRLRRPGMSAGRSVAGTVVGLLIVPAIASAGTGPAATTAGTAAGTTAAGTARGWGYDFYGELGNGRTAEDYTTPVAVRLHARIKVTAVSSSCSGGLALTTAGKVLSWGYNSEPARR
jgi:hypothetical protein